MPTASATTPRPRSGDARCTGYSRTPSVKSTPFSPQATRCHGRCAARRLSAAHIVHESRAVIGDRLEASGAGAHFLDNPLQRIKRTVDVICGHVVFDYDTSRELALTLGMKVSRTAMV
jgi:Acyl-CoA dehydrogenase, C-terminal domain